MLGDSMRRRRGAMRRTAKEARRTAKETRRGPGPGGAWEQAGAPAHRLDWSRWLLGGLGAAAGSFGIGYAVAVFLLFPAPADAGDAVAVPDLVGEQLAEAERILGEQGLALADVAELPNAGESTGIVLAQTPLPGQFLDTGAGVRLAVSAGAARGLIPAVTGLTAAAAEVLLTRIGFQVERRPRPTPQPAGRVVRVEPVAGSERELRTRVVLIVSSGPPPVVILDSIVRYADPVLIPPIPDSIPLRPDE